MPDKIAMLAKAHNISPAFMANFFKTTALEKYTRKLQEFFFWRRGSFLPPHRKGVYVQQFIADEIEAYYGQGLFRLSSVQFPVTTRCTLRCRDCSVMMPKFGTRGVSHIDLTMEQFKQDLDTLLESVDHIGTLLLLGGEPLLNKELPHMLAYAAEKPNLDLVDIVTNCTIIPSEELLETARKYQDKVFFGLSNYASNLTLIPVLKREAIAEILRKNGIKSTLDSDESKWFKYELKEFTCSDARLKSIFAECHWSHCLYVLAGIISICPRSHIGHILGAYELPCEDMILLRHSNPQTIRDHLVRFFEKDALDSCRYCYRHNGLVAPAIQLDFYEWIKGTTDEG